MRIYLLFGLMVIVIMAVLACGSDPTPVPPTETPAPTAAPTPTEPPAATMAPATGDYSPELLAIAAERANGPGAIFVGDLSQLVGPASTKEEGDADGNVPLSALETHRFVYESDYYRSVIDRAKFLDPTPLVSEGENIVIQNACVNRALVFCKIMETFWAPNLAERTNGQLILQGTSFPELGIAGTDTLPMAREGTLDMVNIIGPYVAGELPALGDTILVRPVYRPRSAVRGHHKLASRSGAIADRLYRGLPH